MGPSELGELARESLISFCSISIVSEHQDHNSIITESDGILNGLIESLSYLYSQTSMNKPSKRSQTCRIFSLKMIGPRLLPIPVRRLYDSSINSENDLENQELSEDELTTKNYSSSELAAFTTTIYATEILKNSYSEILRIPFLVLLLGSDTSPENPDNPNPPKNDSPGLNNQSDMNEKSNFLRYSLEISHSGIYGNRIKTLLINRMFHSDSKLSLATIRMFDVILGFLDQFTYVSLVLRNFCFCENYKPEIYLMEDSSSIELSSETPDYEEPIGIDFDLASIIQKHFSYASPSQIFLYMPGAVVAASSKLVSKVSRPSKGDTYNSFENSPAKSDFPELPNSLKNVKDEVPPNLELSMSTDELSTLTDQNPGNLDSTKLDSSLYNDKEKSLESKSPDRDLPNYKNAQFDNGEYENEDEEYDSYLQSNIEKLNLIYDYKLSFWKPLIGNKIAIQSQSNFYPGLFFISLLRLLKTMSSRNIAHNLLITGILSKLLLIGNHDLALYMFLKNNVIYDEDSLQVSGPIDEINSIIDNSKSPKHEQKPNLHQIQSSSTPNIYLYDILVRLSAKAYAKSLEINEFSEKLDDCREAGVSSGLYMAKTDHTDSQNAESDSKLSPRTKRKPRANFIIDDTDSPDKTAINSVSNSPDSRSRIGSPQNLIGSLKPHSPGNRSRLIQQIGEASSNASQFVRGASERIDRKSRDQTHKRFINAYLVLDEFCREIGSIAIAHSIVDLNLEFERIQNQKNSDLISLEKQ
ncbi:hypothetical protein AYI68_g4548 [Smittium mucronatum]|uniref:Uncharacterized protein n=1 Tax=Smittium mucronatum TaxID=133383 RepID=A0A1R0GWT1_9FUNG|nr:hypothetical protein AYI68_g4548 [Smittium mucronatum]